MACLHTLSELKLKFRVIKNGGEATSCRHANTSAEEKHNRSVDEEATLGASKLLQ